MAKQLTIDLCAAIGSEKALMWLSYLNRKGVRIYCISWLDRKTTRATLRRMGIMDYFEDILYTPIMSLKIPHIYKPSDLDICNIAELLDA